MPSTVTVMSAIPGCVTRRMTASTTNGLVRREKTNVGVANSSIGATNSMMTSRCTVAMVKETDAARSPTG